jgi:hypothetical protein
MSSCIFTFPALLNSYPEKSYENGSNIVCLTPFENVVTLVPRGQQGVRRLECEGNGKFLI